MKMTFTYCLMTKLLEMALIICTFVTSITDCSVFIVPHEENDTFVILTSSSKLKGGLSLKLCRVYSGLVPSLLTSSDRRCR